MPAQFSIFQPDYHKLRGQSIQKWLAISYVEESLHKIAAILKHVGRPNDMGKRRSTKHNKWTPHTNEAEEHGVINLRLTASDEFLQGDYLAGISARAFLVTLCSLLLLP